MSVAIGLGVAYLAFVGYRACCGFAARPPGAPLHRLRASPLAEVACPCSPREAQLPPEWALKAAGSRRSRATIVIERRSNETHRYAATEVLFHTG